MTGMILPTFDRSLHTILVVDDNPATRYSTARVIRAAGFQTVEADTGEKAIALSETGVAAVVLDVHLPDMSGFDVCRTIRGSRHTSLIPVVHLSAEYVQSNHQVAGLNAGADAYMVHPVEPQLLTATLHALIRARLAEDSLRRSESRFRAIYDQAPAAMMLVNSAGLINDANSQALALLQRDIDGLAGKPLADYVPAAWKQRAGELLTENTAQAWRGEFPIVQADGQERLVSWKFSEPIEPGIRLAIAQDLTESMEFERQRQQVLEREQAARVAAERISRTKDDFVAVLSHELRTPLSLLNGGTHMLKRPNLSEAVLKKGIDAIEKGVKAQSRIIADILDISRLSTGKLNLHREEVDVCSLALQSLEPLRDSAAEKNISLQFEVPPEAITAWIDITRFQQILWNLASNAIKFSSPGGVVSVCLCVVDDHLLMKVQDQGVGISPEFLPHVFERFSQAAAPSIRGHSGLGLGLSIVKHLVDLHGGSIRADSGGLGQGVSMLVEIPLHDGAGSAPDDQGTHGEHGESLRGKDVVVVEDNADTSEMLRVVLTDQGATVRLAENFEQAMALVDAQWPSLIVSDIGLPGKDGFQLVKALREKESQRSGGAHPVRIVALSAFAREQDRAQALDAGFDHYLEKPLQPHVLIRTLLEHG
jgi:PAS domain S-box-containing protein